MILRDYSQNQEGSFLLDYIEHHNLNQKSTIVEFGAHDGVTNSNSNIFIQAGWKAILLEPNIELFNKLFDNTKGLRFVDKYNMAISDTIGIKKFKNVKRKNFEGHSKLTPDGDSNVFSIRIDDLIQFSPDVMCIDIEGHDNVVIKDMIERTNIRPTMLMVEANDKKDFFQQKKILSNEYELIKQISVNNIWQLKTTF